MQTWMKGNHRCHGILLVEVASDRVKGIVECAIPGCGATQVLFCTHPDQDACIEKHGEEIHRFLLDHDCIAVPN